VNACTDEKYLIKVKTGYEQAVAFNVYKKLGDKVVIDWKR
jgi:hypothetical protein